MSLVGVARLPAAAGRVLPAWHAQAVGAAVGGVDVLGLDLWHLKGTEADVGAELDDDVVALCDSAPAEVVDIVVGQPQFDLAAVTAGRL